MNDHQLWLDSLQASDSLNYHQQQGLTLAQALDKWPFKYVNGQQTAASVALENTPQAKPLEGYKLALTETNDEALL